MLIVEHTEYARHAVDIAHNVDLDTYDALVVISGDGVLHEVINGLLSRPDWAKARQLAVGVISAGSGNAITTSLGTRNQHVATLAAIRGETAKMDIFSMSQPDRPRIYSMLLFSLGMTADSDL
ncbi:sphinganine kinase lcb4, partial [Podila epigama]